MIILHSHKGYYIANDTNGVFDVKIENYKEDEEDVILKV